MKRVANSDEKGPSASTPLCASCDRCRARKTKCDGQRPCSNCAQKYMKKNKLKSIEGVPYADFECVYSPAKRRGPVPGRSSETKKSNKIKPARSSLEAYSQQPQLDEVGIARQLMMAQQQQSAAYDQGGSWGGGGGGGGMYGDSGGMGGNAGLASQQQALQQQLSQLNYITQQQQVLAQQQMSLGQEMEQQESQLEPSAQRIRMDPGREAANNRLVADTVAAHLKLLSPNDIDGNRLRSYYRLSIDELYALPPIPTDQEYLNRLGITMPHMVPKGLQNALLAARFSEIALGALVHGEIQLAMELCNATVHCLRKCVEEPVEQSYLFEVSRAYFLLGVFRAFRGDIDRYLKYRRVCMTHLSQLQDEDTPVVGCEALLAAISFLDAWAYMMHNANEAELPNIDDTIPPVVQNMNVASSSTHKKYDIMTAPACIAADPKNQVWIQGAPPVYLNNEAPLPARSLDALSCAIRSCCDQANSRFASMEKESKQDAEDVSSGGEKTSGTEPFISPTATAVMSHQDELCARNMVLSAFTLLQQHEASSASPQKNQGHHLVISAMDAFLENGDENGSGGFTDSQIQSLLNVCNTVIENPLLLHHGGPTYHMVSNAAILLCHLLNGMHAIQGTEQRNQEMESTVFEEILDTFLSVRKLLNIHRRKLPVKLRCHGIPRPSVSGPAPGKAFIDLGETLMCACRGCQGFVLMACSPCVAAERARAAGRMQDMEAVREAEMAEAEELDKEILDMGAEFDLDDDALLQMLSRIITA